MTLTVVHYGGERKSVTYVGGDDRFVEVAWPMSGFVRFRRVTGQGVADGRDWRLTEESRLALGLPAFRSPPPRPKKPKAPRLNDAQRRTLNMFEGD